MQLHFAHMHNKVNNFLSLHLSCLPQGSLNDFLLWNFPGNL